MWWREVQIQIQTENHINMYLTVEREELISICSIEDQSLPTYSIKYITCISANFLRKLDMLSPYPFNELGERRPGTPGTEISLI